MLFGKGLKKFNPFSTTLFENIVRKEENARNQHFLLFLQSFWPSEYQIIWAKIDLSSVNASNLDMSKIYETFEKKKEEQRCGRHNT